ncbi:uncharacterized protein METZ01_LOCUS427206, partial [marine metagenome]
MFIYKIPASLNNIVKPGTCVNAPINRRMHAGFVVSVRMDSGYKGKILSIDSIRETEFHLPEELWQTLEWMAHYYIAPLGQVLKAAVPNSYLKSYKPKNIQFVEITPEGINNISTFDKKKPAQKRLLESLSCVDEPVKIASLSELISSPYTACGQLEKEGLVKIILQPQITDPFDIMGPGEVKAIQLSKEQQEIVNTVQSTEVGFHSYLLHGVTSSGK